MASWVVISGLLRDGREPSLLLAGETLGSIVVPDLQETGPPHEAAPLLEIVVCAVATSVPALFIPAARVRGEKHASRSKACVELAEDSRDFADRDVEERSIGEDAVKAFVGQIQGEKVLVPDLGSGERLRHADEGRRSVESGRLMAEELECAQVATRATAQVEDPQGCLAPNGFEQSLDVLRDIVVARSFPKARGALLVVLESAMRDFRKCSIEAFGHGLNIAHRLPESTRVDAFVGVDLLSAGRGDRRASAGY